MTTKLPPGVKLGDTPPGGELSDSEWVEVTPTPPTPDSKLRKLLAKRQPARNRFTNGS
jgi:hypothetical protein